MPGSGLHPFRMNCPNNAQDDRHTSDGDAFGTRSIGSEKELLKGKRFPRSQIKNKVLNSFSSPTKQSANPDQNKSDLEYAIYIK